MKVLDPLPHEAAEGNESKINVQKHDPKSHQLEQESQRLELQVRSLKDQKTQLEQEKDRLEYLLEQAVAEQKTDFLELLQIKTGSKKNIQQKITRYTKQGAIIIQVL